MTAIFTGLGSGAERGSGNVLGGAGLLGSGTQGRSGEQVLLNAATGNLMIQQRDEMLVGRGPDAAIVRTYNSLGGLNDDNQDNWRQSTDRRVYDLNTANGTVKRVSGDGSEITYTWNAAASAYVATGGAGAYDKLTFDSGTSLWTWTDGDSQMTETYKLIGSQYFISAQTDTSGNTMTFSYVSGTTLIDKVATADGGYVQYVYDTASGHSERIKSVLTSYAALDTTGTPTRTLTRTTYGYDGLNRLHDVTVDLTPDNTTDSSTYTTVYTYKADSGADMHLVSSISESDGSLLVIHYDTSGRVDTLTQTVTGSTTRVTTIAYDTVARTTTITDAYSQSTILGYDADGNLTSISAPPVASGAARQVTTFGYNGNDDVVSTTDAGGHTTTFSDFTAFGSAKTITDPLNVTKRTFGSNNQLLTETVTGSDPDNATASHTTRYVYDGQNRLIYSISADGRVMGYTQSASGPTKISEFSTDLYPNALLDPTTAISSADMDTWLAGLVHPDQVVRSRISYDARGNILQQTDFARETAAGSTDASGGYRQTNYTYDQAGQLLNRTIVGLNAETFLYDGLGRVTASTDVNNATIHIVFNDAATTTTVQLASGLVRTSTYNKAGELIDYGESGGGVIAGSSHYAYDQSGRLRMTTDATGNNSYIIYDGAGRVVGNVDHDGHLTEYKYDADNRLVATIVHANALSSTNITALQTTSADYDLSLTANRPAADPVNDLWTWRIFDADDRLVEAINGDGAVTTYAYDASNRLIATVDYFKNLTTSQLATIRTTLPTGATAPLPVPDAKDAVSRIFYDKDGNVVGKLDGEGYLTQTVYDAAGQVVETIAYATQVASSTLRATGVFADLKAASGPLSAARTARFVYDGEGLLRYQIDALNHVIGYNYQTSLASSEFGPRRVVTQFAAPIAALSYYSVATVEAAITASTTDDRSTYSVYDVAGRLAYRIDAAGAVTAMVYDSIGRLIKTTQFATPRPTTSLPDLSAMATWAAASYPDTAKDRITRNYYDARGNLTYTIDAEGYVTQFVYDVENRPTETKRWDAKVSASDTTTLNDVTGLVSGGTFAHTLTQYDHEGRVAFTTDGEGFVTRYLYNANGTLASTDAAYGTSDQTQTAFAYDGAGRVNVRTDASTSAAPRATHYDYDGLGNLTSTTGPTGAITSFDYDHTGRLVHQTDALSGETWFEYNAFGQVVRETDPLGTTYTYYDQLGQVKAVRDAENYVTESTYTVFGQLDTVTRRANRATNTASVSALPVYTPSADDATTHFGYDKLGRITSTTDALSVTETRSYNAFGQVSQTIGKLGLVTDFQYDRRGLTTIIHVNAPVFNSAGTQVAAGYDSHRYTYDARGNVLSDTEAYGLAEERTTTFTYDHLDRVTYRYLPKVQNTTNTGTVIPFEHITYDGRGNVIEMRDAAGARTLNYYDALDRVVVQIGPLGAYQTTSYLDVAGVGTTVTTRSYDTAVTLPTTAGGTPPGVPGTTYREVATSYDKLGRQVSQVVSNVVTGTLSGSTYAISTTSLTTKWQYDAAGNVVKTTDPNLGVTYAYYDHLGRKTSQVDAAGYLTTWILDAEGNTTTEHRYATVTSGAAVGTPPTIGTVADGRVTTFTYDLVGRRLSETRVNVGGWAVSDAVGTLTRTTDNTAASDATVNYHYNALGEVTWKREATGDATTYTYDSAGRMTHVDGAAFTDYNNISTHGTFDYSYDAIGDVVRTVQNGARVTTYTYGDGGRLKSMTDPTSAVHGYFYDAAGHKIGESWDRLKSDNATVLHEGLSFQYDLAGNLVRQAFATVSGGVFSDAGDVTTLAYNAHNEVIARSTNGVVQEQSAYDNAGRLWKSNAGDGVWRYYIYDANGNRTAEIDDEGKTGVNLVNRAALSDVLAIATANGAYALGGAYIDGVNATITTYDARNQATSSTQTKRQLSETGTPVDLVSSRTYNAFGETATDTDALSHVTTYHYNRSGRVLSVDHAAVSVGNADHTTTTNFTPTDKFYYDLSGRLVGQDDANGNRTSRVLLAGTGYGQSDALVVSEYHADGGVVRDGYDAFGDLRTVTDEIDRTTSNTYDGMGRLNQVNHAGGLIDYYGYDVLGQRTRHTNNLLGSTNIERTDYDVQGRVVSQIAFGGDATTTSYTWFGSQVTAGINTLGQTRQVTTYQNGRTITEYSDTFGHVASHTDMGDSGGRTSTTTYDTAGRIVARSLDTSKYTYFNTGLVASVTTGLVGNAANQEDSDYVVTRYGYDALGEKLTEQSSHETGGMVDHGYWEDRQYEREYIYDWQYETNSETLQNAVATYDALGRMKTWQELGTGLPGSTSAITPAASTAWTYDAVGNVRHLTASFHYIDTQGATSAYWGAQDHWYTYDQMNRITSTIDNDNNQNGDIPLKVTMTWNKAGERKTATTTTHIKTRVWNPDAYPNGYNQQYYGDPPGAWINVEYDSDRIESYTYDAAGNLKTVSDAVGGYEDNFDGTITPTAPGASHLAAAYQYDLLGRLSLSIDYLGDGDTYAASGYNYFYNVPQSSIANYRSVTYDASGHVTNTLDLNRQGSDLIQTDTSYLYGYGSAYALGAATSSTANAYKNGVFQNTTTTATTYAWYDGAVQGQVASTTGSTSSTTDFSYSSTGVFTGAVDHGKPRTISVLNDALGQVVRRDEQDNTYTTGDPHERWYRFNGKQLGHIGNDGTLNVDYASSVAARAAVQGSAAFRNGTTLGSSSADFDQNYQAINSFSQGATAGTYTVRAGDTLASIAAQLWGDASLWYMLADANGLSGNSELTAGMTLRTPSGVTNIHNNATTFKPYDPADAIGNASPTTPQPQAAKKSNKCGVFGAILLVVIAVAVVAVLHAPIGNLLESVAGSVFGTGGALGVAGTTIVSGAIAGAAGSIVSQGFGVATGIQDKFSWKGVALAAIGGGVGGALGADGLFGKLGAFGKIGSSFIGDVLRGAAGSALTQGIGVATGLQKKFDWAGVAAAGIGAGVGGAVGRSLGVQSLADDRSIGNVLGNGVASMAGGIANAATRSLIEGTDFGDNLMAALPDIIGQTVGSLIGSAINGPSTQTQNAKIQELLERLLPTDQADTIADPELAISPDGSSTTTPLNAADREARIRSEIPQAISAIAAIVTDKDNGLSISDRDLLSRGLAELQRSDRQTAFADDTPGAANSSFDSNGRGVITFRNSSSANFLNIKLLMGVLIHEGVHLSDIREMIAIKGDRNTIEWERRTEQNAWRANALMNQQTGYKQLATNGFPGSDPRSRTAFLTPENSAEMAESSVAEWVKTFNANVPYNNINALGNYITEVTKRQSWYDALLPSQKTVVDAHPEQYKLPSPPKLQVPYDYPPPLMR